MPSRELSAIAVRKKRRVGRWRNLFPTNAPARDSAQMRVRVAKSADIPTRAFDVGVRVIKFCEYLYSRRGVSRLLAGQILSAGTSIGANVEEGQAAQSRADFIAKYCISLKEARETSYRMRLLMAANVVPLPRVGPLAGEVEELGRHDVRNALRPAGRAVGAPQGLGQ